MHNAQFNINELLFVSERNFNWNYLKIYGYYYTPPPIPIKFISSFKLRPHYNKCLLIPIFNALFENIKMFSILQYMWKYYFYGFDSHRKKRLRIKTVSERKSIFVGLKQLLRPQYSVKKFRNIFVMSRITEGQTIKYDLFKKHLKKHLTWKLPSEK